MPFSLIMTVLFGLIGIAVLLVAKATQKSAAKVRLDRAENPNSYRSSSSEPEEMPTWSAYPFLILALLFFIFAVIAIVPTRSIGVVTSFNRPVDTYSNGLHLKAPWEKVKTLDGTIQTNNRTGSDGNPTGDEDEDGDRRSCTDIRIGNGSTACVDNSVRWRIKLEAGQRLYQDYPEGMEAITDSLVARQLKSALNEVLGSYNPLDVIKDKSGEVTVAPDLKTFGDDVEIKLRERVGRDVEIQDVIIPIIRLDKTTQSKINSYQAEVANTRIAEQREATTKAQARANNNLRESVNNEPNVLVAQCMDTLQEMVKHNQTIPIGFSCWPGGSATSVVLPKN